MIIEKGKTGIRAMTQTVTTKESFILLRRYLLTGYSVFQEASTIGQWDCILTPVTFGTLQ